MAVLVKSLTCRYLVVSARGQMPVAPFLKRNCAVGQVARRALAAGNEAE